MGYYNTYDNDDNNNSIMYLFNYMSSTLRQLQMHLSRWSTSPNSFELFFKADGRYRLLCTTTTMTPTPTTSAATPTTTEDQLLLVLGSLCSDAKHLYQTHGFMVRRGLDQDNLFLSKFIDASSALGLSNYGYSAFTHKTNQQRTSQQPPADIYLYNTMIKALSRQLHSANDAILLYNNILITGLRPDTYSFPFALKAVVRLSAIEVGREIHCHAIGTGLDNNVHVMTALIQMYGSCGYVADARKLFDGMRCREVASWNAIIAGYSKVGDVDSARDLFERMPKRNVISWTSVIAGYAQVDRPSEAIFIFRRMQLEGVEPDEVAMLAVLSACTRLGALELGEWIHSYIDKYRLHKTVPLNNALIDMYAKLGNLRKAIEVFENMKHKSVITWTTIISGLTLHGVTGWQIGHHTVTVM